MEITDEKIFKIALITTIIGLIGMIIFAGEINPKEVIIKDIDRGMIDEEVTITGNIDKIQKSSNGKNYILTLNDGSGRINMMIFESTITKFAENEVNLENFENKKVIVTGTVTEFKSTMELIIHDSNSIKIEN
ncbi:putative nucleic acid binding protein [Methanobrevibacter arboriphilus JCM 13429 = DSM 1125]|uniref:Putative nucleic acid binding protein n=1 Tax=Methanobrevibacter arboriphilus JCM 13429 = DSM 1125 TaxID=1300164 RepID=A0A1V6N4Y8_METAZ|nr:OB-fold nucleic acid binding domain-containing protein [Methanobrevibacter arboriphilus]OQD59725.1 putative nucleic acid binding protein [Methanobrevibacter arboriphilus JCM 13429 = DSM 1125]